MLVSLSNWEKLRPHEHLCYLFCSIYGSHFVTVVFGNGEAGEHKLSNSRFSSFQLDGVDVPWSRREREGKVFARGEI